MSPLLQRPSMRSFIATIFGVGGLRFILTVAGLPNSTVRYVSMTAAIAAGAVYFAIRTKTHKERLYATYLLILPYMIIEVLALGYTWLTGQQTIFHAAEYSMGIGIMGHTLGHLVGGLTWEPLTLFVLMEIIWAVSALGARLISRG
jgi:hypothetical protein